MASLSLAPCSHSSLRSLGSDLGSFSSSSASSVPAIAPRHRTQIVMMGNINEGKGLFAPLVVVTRNIVGKKQFNQLRGKAIALHSQVSATMATPSDYDDYLCSPSPFLSLLVPFFIFNLHRVFVFPSLLASGFFSASDFDLMIETDSIFWLIEISGHYRILQVHWCRCQAEAGIDQACQEEWRKARIPGLNFGSLLLLLLLIFIIVNLLDNNGSNSGFHIYWLTLMCMIYTYV